jgi:hypothetical protein
MPGDIAAPKIEDPSAAGEKEGNAISPTRDIIYGRAVDRMNYPDERDQKRQYLPGDRRETFARKTVEKTSKQKEERQPARGVPQDV